MATQIYLTKDYVRQEQIMDLQVSTNTVVHSVNQIHENIVDVKDKVDTTLYEISFKSKEKHKDLMDGLGNDLTEIGKTLTYIKRKSIKEDKPIPSSYLLPSPHISILTPVHNPSEKTIKKKFPFFFPPEQKPESCKKEEDDNISMVTIRIPAYEDIPPHSNIPVAPDLLGKGKFLNPKPLQKTGIKNGI
jgi:hypothetical protein